MATGTIMTHALTVAGKHIFSRSHGRVLHGRASGPLCRRKGSIWVVPFSKCYHQEPAASAYIKMVGNHDDRVHHTISADDFMAMKNLEHGTGKFQAASPHLAEHVACLELAARTGSATLAERAHKNLTAIMRKHERQRRHLEAAEATATMLGDAAAATPVRGGDTGQPLSLEDAAMLQVRMHVNMVVALARHKRGSSRDAARYFDNLLVKGDLAQYKSHVQTASHALAKGYIRDAEPEKALGVYANLRERMIPLNVTSAEIILRALADVGDASSVASFEAHNSALVLQDQHGNYTRTPPPILKGLVVAYAVCGRLQKSKMLLDQLHSGHGTTLNDDAVAMFMAPLVARKRYMPAVELFRLLTEQYPESMGPAARLAYMELRLSIEDALKDQRFYQKRDKATTLSGHKVHIDYLPQWDTSEWDTIEAARKALYTVPLPWRNGPVLDHHSWIGLSDLARVDNKPLESLELLNRARDCIHHLPPKFFLKLVLAKAHVCVYDAGEARREGRVAESVSKAVERIMDDTLASMRGYNIRPNMVFFLTMIRAGIVVGKDLSRHGDDAHHEFCESIQRIQQRVVDYGFSVNTPEYYEHVIMGHIGVCQEHGSGLDKVFEVLRDMTHNGVGVDHRFYENLFHQIKYHNIRDRDFIEKIDETIIPPMLDLQQEHPVSSEPYLMSLLTFYSMVPNRLQEAFSLIKNFPGRKTLPMYKRIFKMCTMYRQRLNLRRIFKRMASDQVRGDRAVYELVLVGEIESFDAPYDFQGRALTGPAGYHVDFLDALLQKMYADRVYPRHEVVGRVEEILRTFQRTDALEKWQSHMESAPA